MILIKREPCSSYFLSLSLSIAHELLAKNGSFSVHHYSIQTLATEMFKAYNTLSETIFSDLFITQPEFACSKLAIETLEQGVKYVRS